jgi:curved DNA-binding protein CbpA
MSQPAPTASGTLAATPLPQLLIYALEHRLTGSFVLEGASREKHALQLTEGAVVAARTAAPVALLGELVTERKVLSRERVEAAVRLARDGDRRLGEVLLEWGVLDDAKLDALLKEQVARRVERIAALPPETRYGYYEGAAFLARAGGPATPCSPPALILRAVQAAPGVPHLADALARLGDAPLRFHPDAPLSALDLGPKERAVVDVLAAKPQSLSELAGRGLCEPERLERLLYVLVALRHLDTGSPSAPVGALPRSVTPPPSREPSKVPPVRQTAPPRSLAPAAGPTTGLDPEPLRRELVALAEASHASYYEVLGVPVEAPAAAIAAAYFQLAKRFHPDRLAPEHAELRELATKVFARMSEAHQMLSDPERRAQYDELVKKGEGAAEEQAEVQRLVRAATSFQKAQVLLKRNNLAGAEEAARAALADAPNEADHIAIVAWLDAQKANADHAALLKELDRAVQMEQHNTRVRWLRGQLLKRMGKARRALDDFRFVVDRDPRHVDAQREIRLYEIARAQGKPSSEPPARKASPSGHAAARSQPAGPGKGGLFGRLFKR